MTGANPLLRLLVVTEPLQRGVEKLGAAGDGRNHADDEVKAEEDGLFGRTGGEAVHGVRAGEAVAGELGLHLEAVEPPLAEQHPQLSHHAEGHIDDIQPSQVAFLSLVGAALPGEP